MVWVRAPRGRVVDPRSARPEADAAVPVGASDGRVESRRATGRGELGGPSGPRLWGRRDAGRPARRLAAETPDVRHVDAPPGTPDVRPGQSSARFRCIDTNSWSRPPDFAA